ncbi:hypothetical protein [Salipaludibacillus sp. CF4.18]|uniref:hypothetical protein n=1 Tax=Salipaludibacillus sp. CF4.18 TaxID=3373081 RepID=UPI003EE4562E
MTMHDLNNQVKTIKKSMLKMQNYMMDMAQALEEVEDQIEYLEDKEMQDFEDQCRADEEKSDQLAG